MTVAIAVACAGLGVALGPLLATLIERVPRKEPLRDAAASAVPQRLRVAVSVAAAALFGAVGVRFSGDWALPAYLVLAASLLVVSVIDLEHYVIPNRVVYPTIALALPLLAGAAALEHSGDRLAHALIGGGGARAALPPLRPVSPPRLGLG